MHPLTTIRNQDLVWSQASKQRRLFELHGGDRLYATLELRWHTKNVTAQAHDGQWSIRPRGLFVQRELTIVDDNAGVPIGVFTWKDKTLTLTNQRVYHWQTTYTTPAIHEDMWLGARDEPLLRYIPQGRLATTARMTLPPKAAKSADIALLAPLGWYLYLMDVGPRL